MPKSTNNAMSSARQKEFLCFMVGFREKLHSPARNIHDVVTHCISINCRGHVGLSFTRGGRRRRVWPFKSFPMNNRLKRTVDNNKIADFSESSVPALFTDNL